MWMVGLGVILCEQQSMYDTNLTIEINHALGFILPDIYLNCAQSMHYIIIIPSCSNQITS